MKQLPSTEKGKKKLLESIAGELPVLGSTVKAIHQFRIEEQNKRFNQFIEHSGIDDNFILTLKDNPKQKSLLLEYVETVLNTPLSEVCLALALIIKDDSIGESLKSVYATSLKGISQGSCNVFIKLMDYLNDHKKEDLKQILSGERKRTLLPIHDSGIEKSERELGAFIRDLNARGIVETGGLADNHGNNTGCNLTSIYLYEKLSLARNICKDD
tara:strand:- start:17432 stop:18073 length:642 start_codon:yes stop_codon:yes gene_type:complete